MLIDKKDGCSLYILLRKELKGFDINLLMPNDVLVIRKDMDENSNSDYFIHICEKQATVTRRDSLVPLHRPPRYIRWLIEDINVRLFYLRKSKFGVGNIVSYADNGDKKSDIVKNIVADENGDSFYCLGSEYEAFSEKLLPEDMLTLHYVIDREEYFDYGKGKCD